MLIRMLCAHEMTKRVCKTFRLNSKRLLRKTAKKMLGSYFILPHPVIYNRSITTATYTSVCVRHLFNPPNFVPEDYY